ncbi:hypothetical protein [Propylenella binzhouense]|uniref:hypothetical protein n=1 Tax=Propylenella binzhouense TaxID=2555902 RepID=UPI001967C3E8|nr:hypothetical protein [Propylenella binzhouense]
MTEHTEPASPKEGCAIDLPAFRAIVDANPPGISSCGQNLEQLYSYVGLNKSGSLAREQVSEALCARMRDAFASGHKAVWQACRLLQTDLIREHVLRDVPLNPYFEVLCHLKDAMRSDDKPSGIRDDWKAAIAAARDHVEINSWQTLPGRTYAREFAVARAAKALEDSGYEIDLSPGWISLSKTGEAKLVRAIETTIAKMGGLNVARRIFAKIASTFDPGQGRYHLVPRISLTGGGAPQVPWGYLLQLAAKHLEGDRPLDDDDRRWGHLLHLSTNYAAVLDVQPYAPIAYRTFDAEDLLVFLRDVALYDTLFRIPQLRPSDVDRIARGMLDFLDSAAPTTSGWSLDQALSLIAHILDPIRDVRGPIILRKSDICRAMPDIPKEIVYCLLDEVLCHAAAGVNRRFSYPTDAPTTADNTLGITFSSRPLLKLGTCYCLIDRSVCAPAFIEALLAALRPQREGLDNAVGLAMERFVEREFVAHGVPTLSGDYDHDTKHGQCDVIADTPQTLIFFELKKKALTRRAQAGMDADLLLDLAGSLLKAHAQAGWHEVRLKQAGTLELVRDGVTRTLSLNGREVEKVAMSMLDYGSFQDRIVLRHFLETTMNATFRPVDLQLSKRFDEINVSLAEIRDQIALNYPRREQVEHPFFNCWFMSVPQLLILLDGVSDAAGFRAALWTCRHITTGSADLYYELSLMRRRSGTVVADDHQRPTANLAKAINIPGDPEPRK